MPRGDRQDRLYGNIELAAEPAATGRGRDPDTVGLETHDLGDLVPVHVGRLSRCMNFDAIAHAQRIARFRFDVGMLDVCRFPVAADLHMRAVEAGIDVTFLQSSMGQDVAGTAGVKLRCFLSERRSDAGDGYQRLPIDGEVFVVDGLDRVPLAHQCGDRISRVPNDVFRENHLVLDVRIDPEAIVSGNVCPRQDALQAGRPVDEVVEISEREAGVSIG